MARSSLAAAETQASSTTPMTLENTGGSVEGNGDGGACEAAAGNLAYGNTAYGNTCGANICSNAVCSNAVCSNTVCSNTVCDSAPSADHHHHYYISNNGCIEGTEQPCPASRHLPLQSPSKYKAAAVFAGGSHCQLQPSGTTTTQSGGDIGNSSNTNSHNTNSHNNSNNISSHNCSNNINSHNNSHNNSNNISSGEQRLPSFGVVLMSSSNAASNNSHAARMNPTGRLHQGGSGMSNTAAPPSHQTSRLYHLAQGIGNDPPPSLSASIPSASSSSMPSHTASNTGGGPYDNGVLGDNVFSEMPERSSAPQTLYGMYQDLYVRVSQLEAAVFPPSYRRGSDASIITNDDAARHHRAHLSSVIPPSLQPPQQPPPPPQQPQMLSHHHMHHHLMQQSRQQPPPPPPQGVQLSIGGSHLLSVHNISIQRRDLDRYCLPVLANKAIPSVTELNSIVSQFENHCPGLDRRDLLSKVREWFRKKREYMAQRIFSQCEKMFEQEINSEQSLSAITARIANEPDLVETIRQHANLEIENSDVALEFCRDKMLTYLNNSYKTYLRRRREGE